MKRYRQLVTELPAKKVVFAFGRFQPPTNGHELLVNAVKRLAASQSADHVIFASRTHDKKKNPLPVDRKVYYLSRMFPNTNFVAANDKIRTPIEAAKALSGKYKNLIMIAGSDRVPGFQKLLNDYNGKEYNFDTIEVISAGERDPDADDATGMSGTKMRDAAKKGDYASFKRGLPKTLTDLDGKRLMNEIRQGMGLEVVKESVKFEVDQIREMYHAGSIFNVGDIVESGDALYQIKKRGANHLLLQDETGNLVNKWLQDVKESNRQFVLQQGLLEMKFTPSDRLKVAKIIASSLGLEDVEKSSNPEQLVNNALRKIRSKPMRPEYIDVLNKMLQTAREADIKYDEKLVPQKVAMEEQCGIKDNESDQEAEHEVDPRKHQQKVGHTLGGSSEQHRKMKVKYHLGEQNGDSLDDVDDLTDTEIDALINNMSEDDYLEAYDDDELAIVDADTGEHVDELREETLNEVLSRAERIKAKVRFARTASKRERRLMVALKTHSNTGTINKRARRLAVKLLKTRMARGRSLASLSVGEKERIERMVQKRKNILNRMAMKLASRVKQTEIKRLSHHKFTSGSPA